MAFTPVERIQIKNAVERVLHVPGNYNGGILEMAMVFDCNIPEAYIREVGKEMAGLLKSHSQVFRNVRLNTIIWNGEEEYVKEVSSLPQLQMGRCFEGYQHKKRVKRSELLAGMLKTFYARSKLVMLFTDGKNQIEDKDLFRENMHPFLYRKLIVFCCDTETEEKAGKISVTSGKDFFMNNA